MPRGRRLPVNVEVKGDVPDRLEAARRTVGALRLVRDVERLVQVSSFHPQVLAALRALGCPASLALLFHGGSGTCGPIFTGNTYTFWAAAAAVSTLTPYHLTTRPSSSRNGSARASTQR